MVFPLRRSLARSAICFVVVIIGLAAVPVSQSGHAVQQKSCTIDHSLTFVATDTCAPGSVTCPSSHGICPFSIKATITGTGVVAASVFQDAKACGPSLGTCTVELLYNVSPGLSSAPTCRMSLTTTALNVHMVCTLRG